MKISVYVKGDRNSTAYYRIYQYFDRLNDKNVSYHIMYPLWVQKRFMPVPKQHILMQILIFICSFVKVFGALLSDYFHKVNIIVIHKRLLSRYMPFFFKYLLRLLSRSGTKIIWDFDDHIVEGREMSQKSFDFFSMISNRIVVTHDFLKALVPQDYQNKVDILPTTDGDLFELAENTEVLKNRENTFDNTLNLVWIGTSPNLFNFNGIIDKIAEAAKHIKTKSGKKVVLRVVCDKPLNWSGENLLIENIKWSRDSAINVLKISHIGLMPLKDTEYNKGKGGFKLVQYMSIGLPCVGSNVGFNKEVIGEGCGYLCNSLQDWIDSITELSDINKWEQYSKASYLYWKEHFSFQYNLQYWENIVNVI